MRWADDADLMESDLILDLAFNTVFDDTMDSILELEKKVGKKN